MNKCLKKINMMDCMVSLKDGHHSQQMKFERVKYKKKKEGKNKSKPQHEAYTIFGEWVNSGKESSISSNDESSKRFTTRTNKDVSSSSNMCFVAKDMESNASDDDSDSSSIDELLDLIYEHQKIIKNNLRN